MKTLFITQLAQPRLIILFAGWGMDPIPFSHLSCEGYDILLVWDYSDNSLTIPDLTAYQEICVVAWSMGVYMATIALQPLAEQLPITLKVAVNGTTSPIDEQRGIHPDIFNSTLQGMTETTVARFRRRMCGGAAALSLWMQRAPKRTVDNLASELQAIEQTYWLHGPADASWWDMAVIGSADRIFTPENQQRAWVDCPMVLTLDTPHLPDFNRVLTHCLVNKDLVRHRFMRSIDSYDSNADVQLAVARQLTHLWLSHTPTTSPRILIEIGVGTGLFTSLYYATIHPLQLELWDIIPIPAHLPGTHRVVDAEMAIRQLPDESVDAIVGSSVIQWFNSPRAFLSECARALTPGGLLVLSSYGPLTFNELAPWRGASRFPSLEALLGMVPATFEVLSASDDTVSLSFESPMHLLRHMSHSGVNGNANSTASSTSAARGIINAGLTHLTYQPIYLILRKL